VLRILTLLTSGLWFGAAAFITFGLHPAMHSKVVQQLLGATNYGYYGGAVEQIVLQRYGVVLVLCSVVACVNLFTLWLYFGRLPQRPWLALLGILITLSLVQSLWLQPRLERLHRSRHAVNQRIETREAASKSFGTWQTLSHGVNWVLVLGLAVNLWRAGNPTDPARFVSTAKFRG
jgi:hypothetical protein